MNDRNEVRPYGPRALLVTPIGGTRPADFAAAVTRGARADVVEVVPAAATVLVLLRDGATRDAVADWLVGLDVAVTGCEGCDAADDHDIVLDVVYDGADLAAVADAAGLTVADVIGLHSAAVYRCEFCGFAPGFAYLGGLDSSLVLPRRSTPRTSVPAGSVAIAGPYSAVYPSPSPGGWHLLGHTDAVLWDLRADPPARIVPGTAVRFRAVRSSIWLSTVSESKRSTTRSVVETEDNQMRGRAALRVVSAGVATSFQDGGRPGHASLGVPASGALDGARCDLVNRLVGNPPEAAVLETAGGVVLKAIEPVLVADSNTGAVRSLAVGDTLDVEPAHSLWAYVAVRGGFAVEPVLGSRSFDTLSRIGPVPPGAGDVLPVGPDPRTPITTDQAPVEQRPLSRQLRLWPGPHLDWFFDDAFDRLVAATWLASAEMSRVGLRLRGPMLRLAVMAGRELPSAGLVLGAIQVPPDGQPVVMFADHPTTGGYPVIGVVDERDLPALVQARLDTRVSFQRGTVANPNPVSGVLPTQETEAEHHTTIWPRRGTSSGGLFETN